MTFDFDCTPQSSLSHLIQQASTRTGFSPADIAAMVNSDLETEYLLDYISAVMSNQMN